MTSKITIVELATLAIVTSTILISTSAYAEEYTDQGFTGPFDTTFPIGTAQTFIPTSDNVSSVDIFLLERRSTPTDIAVCVFDMISRSCIDERIVTTVIPSSDIRNLTPIHLTFTNPIPIASGIEYGLSVKAVDPRTTTVVLGNSDPNSYMNGYALPPGGFSGRGDIGFVTYYEAPVTPEEQTQQIVDSVLELLTSGDISTQSAQTLTATLNNAIDKITDGNTTAADGMLNAFINKVEQMINTGKINQEDGDALIAAAQAVIDNL